MMVETVKNGSCSGQGAELYGLDCLKANLFLEVSSWKRQGFHKWWVSDESEETRFQ